MVGSFHNEKDNDFVDAYLGGGGGGGGGGHLQETL